MGITVERLRQRTSLRPWPKFYTLGDGGEGDCRSNGFGCRDCHDHKAGALAEQTTRSEGPDRGCLDRAKLCRAVSDMIWPLQRKNKFHDEGVYARIESPKLLLYYCRSFDHKMPVDERRQHPVAPTFFRAVNKHWRWPGNAHTCCCSKACAGGERDGGKRN